MLRPPCDGVVTERLTATEAVVTVGAPPTAGWCPHRGSPSRESTTMRTCVRARPHAFPRSGELRPEDTALVVVDMQVDFCGEGGYMDRLGGDLARLRAPIEPIRRVLAEARSAGLRVVHTREGYGPDLADLQPWKRRVRWRDSVRVGDPGP